MRLTLINGSPRGARSNTTLLLNALSEGFLQDSDNSVEVHNLATKGGLEAAIEAFSGAEVVLLAFPLYSDAMPSIVKTFIEGLEPLQGRKGNPAMAFLVQCGFPEALHLRTVERYLNRLAVRLDAACLGCMVRGGIEGIQAQPPRMTRKLFAQMRQFGRDLAQTGRFDPQRQRQFAGTERFTGIGRMFLHVGVKISSIYWNQQLKKNNVYEKRMDAPYRTA